MNNGLFSGVGDAAGPGGSSIAGAVPRAIINGYSTSGWTPRSKGSQNIGQLFNFPLVPVAGVLQSVLSLRGPGTIQLLTTTDNSSVSGLVVRLQLTLDGIVVFDSVSATYNASPNIGAGIIGVSEFDTGRSLALQPVPFGSSCELKASFNTTFGTSPMTGAIIYTLN